MAVLHFFLVNSSLYILFSMAGSPLHGIVRAGPPLHGTVRAGSPLHGTVRLRAYTGHGVTFNF